MPDRHRRQLPLRAVQALSAWTQIDEQGQRTSKRDSMIDNVRTLKDIFAGRPVLCDGAMGTVLYARGVFINRCYDELNLSDPNLILSVHEDYLQAGAEIIETNTFGANRFRLARHGLAGKVAEINTAGVKLAKQAVAHFKDKQAC